jgi:hypothetical protein
VSLDIWLKVYSCLACLRGESTVFDWNFTHNMVSLWKYLGCLDALYESDGWGMVKDARPTFKKLKEAFAENPNATIRVSR